MQLYRVSKWPIEIRSRLDCPEQDEDMSSVFAGGRAKAVGDDVGGAEERDSLSSVPPKESSHPDADEGGAVAEAEGDEIHGDGPPWPSAKPSEPGESHDGVAPAGADGVAAGGPAGPPYP